MGPVNFLELLDIWTLLHLEGYNTPSCKARANRECKSSVAFSRNGLNNGLKFSTSFKES